MRRQILGVVTLALAVSGCSSLTPSDAPPPGALVRVTVVVPDGAGLYIEGAVRYLRITGPTLDTRLRLNDGAPTAISVPGGQSYRLESWARPCGGNCGNLEPATDRCTGTFPFAGGHTTAIEITAPPGKACTLAVLPASAAQ